MASSRLERIGTIFTRVEGLLKRGAMKPDDRPIWFDVYKAFPPIREPKFAQPKPDINIKPIFYPEDQLRAKFHNNGHGLGAVNMLSPAGETHTKKLIKKYGQLQSDGVPESELIEKTVAAVDIERPERLKDVSTPQLTSKNSDSVTAKVLQEADLKNIFKE